MTYYFTSGIRSGRSLEVGSPTRPLTDTGAPINLSACGSPTLTGKMALQSESNELRLIESMQRKWLSARFATCLFAKCECLYSVLRSCYGTFHVVLQAKDYTASFLYTYIELYKIA
jgi:hypothetical protein